MILFFFQSVAFEEVAAYDKEGWLNYVTALDQETFSDPVIARRLDLMENIQVAALPEEQLRIVSCQSCISQFRKYFAFSCCWPFIV
jgi:hypothetical protein